MRKPQKRSNAIKPTNQLQKNFANYGRNEMYDEWEKYHKWYIKTYCVTKRSLPNKKEIENILVELCKVKIFPDYAVKTENEWRPMTEIFAHAIAKRIREGK